jgi:hypothetical protein
MGPVADQPLSRVTHYLRFRHWYEATVAVLLALIIGIADVTTTATDLRRSNTQFQLWELINFEFTSIIVILALIPLIGSFSRRTLFSWTNWRAFFGWHLLASFFFCLVHVSLMVALRHVVYYAVGAHYRVGPLLVGLFYEYMKDIRIYFGVLAVIYCYRFILSQLQGEARTFTQPDVGPPVDSIERPQRFLVRKLGKEFLVAADDIEWLEAQGNYVNLHVHGRAYPLRSTMSAVQSLLDPDKFVRVHRSFIVNLDHLVEIEPLDTGDAQLKLRDGALVACSRTYRAELRERSGLASAPVTQ